MQGGENRAGRSGIRAIGLLSAACLLLCLLPAAAEAGKRGLEIGFGDVLYGSTDAGERAEALKETVEVRGSTARLIVGWRGVAPREPSSSFQAADPGDPEYDWSRLDASVRDATDSGLHVVILLTSAPDWAEGGNRPPPPCPSGKPCDNNPQICPASGPPCAAPGTWKPNPRQLAKFGTALARRYSGEFAGLPRVRDFLLWAEPNLVTNLTPQWDRKSPKSPVHYAKMLNAFYKAVHRVDGSNRVAAGGTAPYGAGRGVLNMRPLLWWRKLLCLKGQQKLRTTKCRRKAKFDVLAHHPINTSGGPRRSAIHPDDVSTPDLRHLVRALRFAERKHTVRPGGRRPVWATELWWETDPPDPGEGHPSPGKQARWYTESLYSLWKQGASMVLLLQVQDSPYDGNPGRLTFNYQTGVYYADGTPKPAAAAVRFPFVVDRKRKGRVLLWGKAPAAGKLVVEEKRKGGGFRRVAKLRASAGQVFQKRVRLRSDRLLRARVAGETSPLWTPR